MKKKKISDALSEIDEDILQEAAEYKVPQKKAALWVRWTALAACLAVFVGVGFAIAPFFGDKEGPKDERLVAVSNLKRPYRKVAIQSANMMPVFSWDDKKIFEQYTEFSFNDCKYSSRGREVGQSLIGEKLDTVTAIGVDDITNKSYSKKFDAYSIKNIDSKLLAAIKTDDGYYIYINHSRMSAATLGEFVSSSALDKNADLDLFGDGDGNYFALENDDAIWSIIEECKDAPQIPEKGVDTDKPYISFTITSEGLGSYKQVFRVYEKGYIWTNILDRLEFFHIGEDAAKRIINYAKANGKKTEVEPYSYNLYGNIIEIGEKYVVINDAIMCSDPDDGISYRLSLEDIDVRRCVKALRLKKGDIVMVYFNGQIDVANGNEVKEVSFVTEAKIIEQLSETQKGHTETVSRVTKTSTYGAAE